MNRNRICIETGFVLSHLHHWSHSLVGHMMTLSVMSLSIVILGLTSPTLAQTQTESQPNDSQPNGSQPLGTAIARPTLRLGSQGATVTELQALLKLLGFYQGAVDGMFQDSTAIAVVSFQQAAGLTADGIVGSNTWNRLLPPGTSTSSGATSSNPTHLAPSNPAPANPATPNPASSNTTATTPAAIATAPRPVTASASAAATSDPMSLPTLRLGMRGSAVTQLQQRLRAIGVFSGEIDGIFGAATQTAVQAAQRRYNLTPDGVVGNATWGALLR